MSNHQFPSGIFDREDSDLFSGSDLSVDPVVSGTDPLLSAAANSPPTSGPGGALGGSSGVPDPLRPAEISGLSGPTQQDASSGQAGPLQGVAESSGQPGPAQPHHGLPVVGGSLFDPPQLGTGSGLSGPPGIQMKSSGLPGPRPSVIQATPMPSGLIGPGQAVAGPNMGPRFVHPGAFPGYPQAGTFPVPGQAQVGQGSVPVPNGTFMPMAQPQLGGVGPGQPGNQQGWSGNSMGFWPHQWPNMASYYPMYMMPPSGAPVPPSTDGCPPPARTVRSSTQVGAAAGSASQTAVDGALSTRPAEPMDTSQETLATQQEYSSDGEGGEAPPLPGAAFQEPLSTVEKPFRQALRTVFEVLPDKLSLPDTPATMGYVSSDEEDSSPNLNDQYLTLPLNSRTRAYMDFTMATVQQEGRKKIEAAHRLNKSARPSLLGQLARFPFQTYKKMYDLGDLSWQNGQGLAQVAITPNLSALELKPVLREDFAVSSDNFKIIEQSARSHLGVASTLYYFQRANSKLLKELSSHLDDILLTSSLSEQAQAHTQKAMTKIRAALSLDEQFKRVVSDNSSIAAHQVTNLTVLQRDRWLKQFPDSVSPETILELRSESIGEEGNKLFTPFGLLVANKEVEDQRQQVISKEMERNAAANLKRLADGKPKGGPAKKPKAPKAKTSPAQVFGKAAGSKAYSWNKPKNKANNVPTKAAKDSSTTSKPESTEKPSQASLRRKRRQNNKSR